MIMNINKTYMYYDLSFFLHYNVGMYHWSIATYVHMYVYLFTSIFIRTGLLMIGVGKWKKELVTDGTYLGVQHTIIINFQAMLIK